MTDTDPEHGLALQRKLAAAVLGRDQTELQNFYEQHFQAVYRYVLCRMNSHHAETEEVVQDVFFNAFKDIHTYDGSHSPVAWLLGIARHRILDHYRKLGRRPVVELMFSQFDKEFTQRLFELESAEIPDRELERSELATVVELVLSQLPKQYESVLRLRYIEEKAVKELADVLKMSPKAAEALLYRARNMFRDAFRIADKNSSLVL